jgi:hypothetical protein
MGNNHKRSHHAGHVSEMPAMPSKNAWRDLPKVDVSSTRLCDGQGCQWDLFKRVSGKTLRKDGSNAGLCEGVTVFANSSICSKER